MHVSIARGYSYTAMTSTDKYVFGYSRSHKYALSKTTPMSATVAVVVLDSFRASSSVTGDLLVSDAHRPL